MDETPTLWLDDHIDVFGRPLHKYSRIILHILALWWVIEPKFVFRKICGGEIYHCLHNFQVFKELSQLKISSYQLSLVTLLSLGTLTFVITLLIWKLRTLKDSCPHLLLCACLHLSHVTV